VPVYHSAAPGKIAAGASRRACAHLGALRETPARRQHTQCTPLRFRVLLLICTVVGTPQLVFAQTIDERIASLESQVAELWQLYEHAYAPGTMVPAELVGNEHLRWGYPGGVC
jgi:hypothetical protein